MATRHRGRVVEFNGQKLRLLGVPNARWRDMYYAVLVSRWRLIIFFLAGGYLLVNFVFACLYLLGGDCIANARPGSLWDAFFFSVQTWATIGYGGMAPKSRYADVLVAIESFSGLISMSVVTGLIFSKFAQPRAKVRFTKNILISRFDGRPVLMFRLGNMRGNQIVEARLHVVFSTEVVTAEKQVFRKLIDLPLVRQSNAMFTLTWQVMHIIDGQSPFYGLTHQDIADGKIQVIVSMSGTDEQFNQTIHARRIYMPEDFVWDHRFEDVIGFDDDVRVIDYGCFDILVPIENKPPKSNSISMKELVYDNS